MRFLAAKAAARNDKVNGVSKAVGRDFMAAAEGRAPCPVSPGTDWVSIDSGELGKNITPQVS